MLCCRAETLQGTIGLSCRATLWSDFNAKGTRGLLGLEAEFLVHVTSPKGRPDALLEFNQYPHLDSGRNPFGNWGDRSQRGPRFLKLPTSSRFLVSTLMMGRPRRWKCWRRSPR